MKKITYFVGFNDRHTKKPIEDAKERLISIAQKHFNGFTIIDTTGFWQGERENGCAVILYVDHFEDFGGVYFNVLTFEADVLDYLNQDSISREVVDNNKTEIEFIYRKDREIFDIVRKGV